MAEIKNRTVVDYIIETLVQRALRPEARPRPCSCNNGAVTAL
jgi:hypothetical protein